MRKYGERGTGFDNDTISLRMSCTTNQRVEAMVDLLFAPCDISDQASECPIVLVPRSFGDRVSEHILKPFGGQI